MERLNSLSMKDVLNPKFAATFDLHTASNCLGSPANIILALIPSRVVHKPDKKLNKPISDKKVNQK